VIYFTGNEGNVLMPDQRPKKNIRSINGLLNYILSENAIFSCNQIEKLVGVKADVIKESLLLHVNKYPELNYNQKYVQFVFSENCLKLQFEGEDRNRFYFWTVAPFYSSQFFYYVMNIPDRQKKYYKLYREFFNVISPETANIKNSNWNFPITSNRVYTNEFAKIILQNLPNFIRQALRRKYAPAKMRFRPNINLIDFIKECFDTSSLVSEFISRSETFRIINNNCNELQFYSLLTLIGYISEFEIQLENSPIKVSDKL
jgi:asparagine synthase (glutamine-hydrolysing)